MPAPQTVSMMYFPTTPLEFARPFGKCLLLEFSRMRTVSTALPAARITRFFAGDAHLFTGRLIDKDNAGRFARVRR